MRRTSLTIYTDYFLYIISASKLGEGESPKLNTASSQSSQIGNQLLTVSLPSQNIIGEFYQSVSQGNNYNIILTSSNINIFKSSMFNNCNITYNSILLPTLEKGIMVRAYSTKSPKSLIDSNNNTILCPRSVADNKLNPNFVTGFADGESCFIIGVSKDSRNYSGYRVKVHFQIHLHNKDQTLLENIQNHFDGVGSIYKQFNRDVVIYSVTSITDLEKIINHFDKYPLITKK